MNEAKAVNGKAQIRKLKFLAGTDFLLGYEKNRGWATEPDLYESLGFVAELIMPDGKERVVTGCVEYAPSNGRLLEEARHAVIGHGKRYTGRHIDPEMLRNLPGTIYRDFQGREAHIEYAGPMSGGHFGSY